MPGTGIFSVQVRYFFLRPCRPLLHRVFFLSFFVFLSFFFFFSTGQCPSEKSINLACGLANVRTIRQRTDWWEGMDSGWPWRGWIRGRTRVRWTLQLRPTCNKAATILRARRAGWRGNLPTRWKGDEETTGMNPCCDSLQGASIVFDKGRRFLSSREHDVVVFRDFRAFLPEKSPAKSRDLPIARRIGVDRSKPWRSARG